MLRLSPILVVLGATLVLSGCTFTDDPPAPQAPPTIVNVTPPASDGGMSVLLTLALVAAFVGLVLTAGMTVLWLNERGRRQVSEDMVVELTGLPPSRARVSLTSGNVRVVRASEQPQVVGEPRRALQQ